MTEQTSHTANRWTIEEEATLKRYVRARPQNLHSCFTAVAEQIGRTEGAVRSRWYNKVSKEPDEWYFFTAGSHHVSRNRKNGNGVQTTSSIWRRLLTVLRGVGA